MKPEHKPQQKKRYSKPRLRTIKLAADEVLATGCKTSPASTGFGGNPCNNGTCVSTFGS